ncbi:MAG: MotA/TolQ/ExbB proton channel family protein [Nevskiales bacterium]|uniref:MotA/TolQ/ExbB proton channel family protein n=1 Tax=Nevskia soli TaxID=418856 RepID=UPI0004A7247D|nr:MotA/TolQ/ExbB proton channel family protein [Nevskia soli]MDB5974127.1 MotA/TolQ/ExbB proton channel family protein [Nevskia sp.]
MHDALLAPLLAFRDMVELGGFVVTLIFAACLIMWSIVIERWWYFSSVLPRQAERLLAAWEARTEHMSWTAHQVRKAMISRLNAGMSANLPLLRVLVPLCPLLGLLGTVTGMLNVFDAMAARGSADARSMANGVSEAMICTLSGLAVSITGLYPNFYFRRRVSRETERLADKFQY